METLRIKLIAIYKIIISKSINLMADKYIVTHEVSIEDARLHVKLINGMISKVYETKKMDNAVDEAKKIIKQK